MLPLCGEPSGRLRLGGLSAVPLSPDEAVAGASATIKNYGESGHRALGHVSAGIILEYR